MSRDERPRDADMSDVLAEIRNLRNDLATYFYTARQDQPLPGLPVVDTAA